jgi:hypothetical protein
MMVTARVPGTTKNAPLRAVQAASNEPSEPGGTGTKRTRSPGANRDGGERCASNGRIVVRPMICQPPGDVCG